MIRLLLALVFLCLASPAWAAITEVSTMRATKGGVSADSTTLAFPNNVTTGDLLIVGGNAWDAVAANVSIVVTDSVSTSYTVKICTEVPTATGSTGFIAYGLAPSSGANTVTVNPGGATDAFDFAIDAFAGVHATPLDVDGGTSTGTSTNGSDSITTTVANALVAGLWAGNDGTNAAPGSGYTEIGENATSLDGFNFEFQIVTTAQAYTVNWTHSSTTWAACTLSFKPAGAGSTRRPVSPMVLP